MKILFCASDRPGHLATGPNAWIQRLIPVLRDTYNLDVHTLFIYNGDLHACPTLSLFKEEQWPIHLINRSQTPYIADQVKQIVQLVKQESFTVLVANLVIPAYYAARYLKPFHIPVVGVMHSNDLFYKGVIAKFIHGDAKNNLSHSVAVSKYIHRLSSAEENQTELVVIPCGTPIPTERAMTPKDQHLKVIYAGRIEIKQKQILKLTDAFINASNKNTNLEFSIYGDGSESEQVASILNHSKVKHNVSYKGPAAPSEMLQIMSQHQVFTLMSDYEGMPVALMEAMACGLVPVCLNEESGINEIINHGVNGFIVKDRGEDFQAKLKLLSEDGNLWNIMSKNAIDTINKTYSSDITHQLWFSLLNRFEDNLTRKVRLPKRIELEGELLCYGDNRKPHFSTQFKKDIALNWLKFKQFIRPRARLRALFKK